MASSDSLHDLPLRSAGAEYVVLKAGIETARSLRDRIKPHYEKCFPESGNSALPGSLSAEWESLTPTERVELQELHDTAWRLSERARSAFEQIGVLDIPVDHKRAAEILYKVIYYDCTMIICFNKFRTGLDDRDPECPTYLAAMRDSVAEVQRYLRIMSSTAEPAFPSPVSTISSNTLTNFGAASARLTIAHWHKTMVGTSTTDPTFAASQYELLATYASLSLMVVEAVVPSHFPLAGPQTIESFFATLRSDLQSEDINWNQMAEMIARYQRAASTMQLLSVEHIRAVVATLQALGLTSRHGLEILIDEYQSLGRAVAGLRNV